MSRIYLFFVGVMLVGCVSARSASDSRGPSAAAEVTPKLYMQPSYIFDAECAQKTGYKIDPEIQTQLSQRLPEFQNEWENYAARLITESEHAAGRSFSRKEFSVALTLCKWTPMGDPAFIVSVRPYLGANRKDGNTQLPFGLITFISMTHHELLHSLVDNVINEKFFNSSVILEKYKKEPFNVLVHLHLMAIQFAANEKLKDSKLMEATNQLYAYIGGDYARAWEIVKKEGADKLLQELRAYNSGNN